jgi:hypothetical protein
MVQQGCTPPPYTRGVETNEIRGFLPGNSGRVQQRGKSESQRKIKPDAFGHVPEYADPRTARRHPASKPVGIDVNSDMPEQISQRVNRTVLDREARGIAILVGEPCVQIELRLHGEYLTPLIAMLAHMPYQPAPTVAAAFHEYSQASGICRSGMRSVDELLFKKFEPETFRWEANEGVVAGKEITTRSNEFSARRGGGPIQYVAKLAPSNVRDQSLRVEPWWVARDISRKPARRKRIDQTHWKSHERKNELLKWIVRNAL